MCVLLWQLQSICAIMATTYTCYHGNYTYYIGKYTCYYLSILWNWKLQVLPWKLPWQLHALPLQLNVLSWQLISSAILSDKQTWNYYSRLLNICITLGKLRTIKYNNSRFSPKLPCPRGSFKTLDTTISTLGSSLGRLTFPIPTRGL